MIKKGREKGVMLATNPQQQYLHDNRKKRDDNMSEEAKKCIVKFALDEYDVQWRLHSSTLPCSCRTCHREHYDECSYRTLGDRACKTKTHILTVARPPKIYSNAELSANILNLSLAELKANLALRDCPKGTNKSKCRVFVSTIPG